MNKKVLIALFAAPVALLAADKVLGLNVPGGVKEGLRKTTSHVSPHVSAGSETEIGKSEVKSLSGLDAKTLARFKEVMKEMQDEEATESLVVQYHSSDFIYPGNEEAPEELFAFLDKEVEDVLEETNIFEIDLDRQFSRCASGYRYVILKSDEVAEKGSGVMVRDEGCWDRPIAVFQYEYATKDVHVDMPGELGSLSVRDFLSLYEKVMHG